MLNDYFLIYGYKNKIKKWKKTFASYRINGSKEGLTYENYKVFILIQLESISIIKTSVHFLNANFQIISLEFHFNSL